MEYFDLHCDTLTQAYQTGQTLYCNTLQIDWLRARCFDRYAQFFAVFVPDDMPLQKRWNYTVQMLLFARSKGALDGKGENQRLLLGIENAAAIGTDLQRLNRCYDLGVKYITITWNGSNEWGKGCLSGCRSGLTECGKCGVKRMERLGITPDVSHLNEYGFWDVLSVTHKPVLATHTACKKVCNHPRNLDDAQLCALAETGGLIGLTLYPEHLGGDSFESIERHLVHLWETVGPRHIALGGDLDGIARPAGGNDLSVIPSLYAYLCRKNYDERHLRWLFFGNCYDFYFYL